jgi:hypothetical protein
VPKPIKKPVPIQYQYFASNNVKPIPKPVPIPTPSVTRYINQPSYGYKNLQYLA